MTDDYRCEKHDWVDIATVTTDNGTLVIANPRVGSAIETAFDVWIDDVVENRDRHYPEFDQVRAQGHSKWPEALVILPVHDNGGYRVQGRFCPDVYTPEDPLDPHAACLCEVRILLHDHEADLGGEEEDE